ncbi:MAG: carboxypeptidase regulatory-like domain-containing protein [Myxococcaceae bacterium]|nr:carboxypeptidase regulatory-like domain-containing protein [Myxococcaceae bacterium]
MRTQSLATFLLLAAACGPVDDHESAYVDHDIGSFEQGLNVGAAGGCDTSIVRGLTAQLYAEMNCIAPNTMVNFTGPNISITSPVEPYLAPPASAAMKRAVAASGTNITINSAWRSVAQQYLLYKWWKAGQCGIQIAAAPGKSNHQSGRALDVPSYSFWIPKLQAQGWRWLGSSDRVHFDYNGAADQSARSVLAFQRLWNKNNSSKLAEDGSWGPNTESAMSRSPATGFGTSGCAPKPPPPPTVTTGTFKGKVFKLNAAAPTDVSVAVSGATVKVGGKVLTTDAAGAFTVVLPAATYTLSAEATGYTAASVSKALTAGQTVTVNVGLAPVGVADTMKPEIDLLTPESGAKLDVAKVTVTGTASDDRSGVKTFTMAQNGGVAKAVALQTGGDFSVDVVLAPGANTLVFSATDGAGNVGTLSVPLTFRAGLEGLVTSGDEGSAMPLEGVQVELQDGAGMVLLSTTTGPDGTYAIELTDVPAERVLVARLGGYADYRSPVSLSADARTQWSFTMDRSMGTGLRILSPEEGDVVDTASVSVAGVVDGFAPTSVLVNGTEATLYPGGRFGVSVGLLYGTNAVVAVARGANGETAEQVVHVRRESGTMAAGGGCSAAPGTLVLLAAAALLRRRARHS